MRNIILFLFAGIIIISGCKKDEDSSNGITPAAISTKIAITDFQITGDKVSITWSHVNSPEFKEYYVIRRDFKSPDTVHIDLSTVIGHINDSFVTSFTDAQVPELTYLEYQVVSISYNPNTRIYTRLFSNVKSIARPEFKTFSFDPKDILQDAANHRLYVIDDDSGKISILDYAAKEITRKIYTNASLGFSSLGTFNGTQELYVPRNDGFIFIYNANTLEKIDQLVAGQHCYTVVYNNGKLFAITDTTNYQHSIKAFDRASKNLISSTLIDQEPLHITLAPGSNTKLYGINSDNISYYEFDATGHYIDGSNQSYSLGFDFRNFEVFPNGQGFITSSTGLIFSGSLNLVQNLPYGNYQFSGFTFNSSLTKIYAACSNYKKVIAYSCPGYAELNTYPCLGYPDAIFTDGSNLILLSRSNLPYYYGTPFYLETIPM